MNMKYKVSWHKIVIGLSPKTSFSPKLFFCPKTFSFFLQKKREEWPFSFSHKKSVKVMLRQHDNLFSSFFCIWDIFFLPSTKIFWKEDLLLHRWCTRVENPGEGVAQIFAEISRGVKAFRKNCQGVPLFWVLLHFY